MRLSTVFQYVSWAKNEVRRVSLRGIDLQGHNKFLRDLAIKCRELHTLELHSGGELRQSLLDATSRAKNLRTLILSSKVSVKVDIVHHILDTSLCLEIARFGCVEAVAQCLIPDWKNPEHLHLRELSLAWGNTHPPPIVLVRVQGCQLICATSYAMTEHHTAEHTETFG